MKKVFIIHGLQGEPNGGWRPWLMRELAKRDIYATSLSMPSPEKPVLDEWLYEIERLVERDKEDEIYLVGHSLGGTCVLRFLEKYNFSNLKGVVSVSGPVFKIEGKSVIDEFLEGGFDWEKIKNRGVLVSVIHGDDDPVVPVKDAREISEKLSCPLVLVPNGAHLNGHAGIYELPELLSLFDDFTS